MKNTKPMLEGDYIKIITTGLCNSPDHLLQHYYKKQIENLKDRRYSEEEIEYNLRHVLGLMRESIKQTFEFSMKRFVKYEQADKNLPEEKRMHYPKPDINQTPIIRMEFPKRGSQLIFPTGRMIYLKDLLRVEDALNKIFSSSKSSMPKHRGATDTRNSSHKNTKP